MKRKAFRYRQSHSSKAHELKEGVSEAPPPAQINVRAAKDNLSSLLEEASRGREIIITSDGEPKAKLVPYHMKRKRFRVDWELLRSMPLKPGAPTAEEIVREERDGRP
jgi:prevent-host-death family protein